MTSKHEGKTFGELTVVDGWTVTTPAGNYRQIFKVRCRCGSVYETSASNVLKGATTRCKSCARKDYKARSASGYKHPLYQTWQGMINRCHSPVSPGFVHYGARGIAVCDRWRGMRGNGETATIDGFHAFVGDMGDKPSVAHSIDRIGVNGDYTLQNCRWATWEEQANNKQATMLVEVDGVSLTMAQWARRLGVTAGKLSYVARLPGKSPEAAVALYSAMDPAMRARYQAWTEQRRRPDYRKHDGHVRVWVNVSINAWLDEFADCMDAAE